MLIRKATAEEMLRLWGYEDIDSASPTARFFYRSIAEGNAVFWALDHRSELIGELYAFLDLEDKDFADGNNTAYLCAFRVKPEYRGRGLGTSMMEKALEELKKAGFHKATIGVESNEQANILLYSRLGFIEKIKDCHYDPCGLDEDMQPIYEEDGWWLLAKEL